MNFHNIVIHEDKRNFIKREIVAHPDRDGYGLETFTLTNTCGTFVVVPSLIEHQHTIENMISITVSPSSSEIKMTKTKDDNNQITITIVSKSHESSASSVLRLTTSDCDIDEELLTDKNTIHTRQVLRCDANIAELVHQQSKTILILPFKKYLHEIRME